MIPVFLLNVLVPSEAAMAAPAPVPLFLKAGFSSVLEFDAIPSRVVIGDGGSFQIERLDKSLVVRPVVEEATTNLLVYFKGAPTRMFLLRATMAEEPALYRKYGNVADPSKASLANVDSGSGGRVDKPSKGTSRIASAKFDAKKDFLTLDAIISAGPEKLVPDWNAARLKKGVKEFSAKKLWAERSEVQAGSAVKSRFIFEKPDIGVALKGAYLVLPLKGSARTIILNLGGSK
jgi:hypothetical protein